MQKIIKKLVDVTDSWRLTDISNFFIHVDNVRHRIKLKIATKNPPVQHQCSLYHSS